jgi:hypothetical protein
MPKNWSRAAIVMGVLAIAGAGTTSEAAQSKCLVGKNKCVSKKAGSLLKCEQNAETAGKPTDPNADGCVDEARAKFDGGEAPEEGCFEKLESEAGNDCINVDDTAALEAIVDSCVGAFVQAVDPEPIDQTKCGVGKKKCVAKKLSGLLKCYRKRRRQGAGGSKHGRMRRQGEGQLRRWRGARAGLHRQPRGQVGQRLPPAAR